MYIRTCTLSTCTAHQSHPLHTKDLQSHSDHAAPCSLEWVCPVPCSLPTRLPRRLLGDSEQTTGTNVRGSCIYTHISQLHQVQPNLLRTNGSTHFTYCISCTYCMPICLTRCNSTSTELVAQATLEDLDCIIPFLVDNYTHLHHSTVCVPVQCTTPHHVCVPVQHSPVCVPVQCTTLHNTPPCVCPCTPLRVCVPVQQSMCVSLYNSPCVCPCTPLHVCVPVHHSICVSLYTTPCVCPCTTLHACVPLQHSMRVSLYNTPCVCPCTTLHCVCPCTTLHACVPVQHSTVCCVFLAERHSWGAVHMGTVQGHITHAVYRIRPPASQQCDRHLADHCQHDARRFVLCHIHRPHINSGPRSGLP